MNLAGLFRGLRSTPGLGQFLESYFEPEFLAIIRHIESGGRVVSLEVAVGAALLLEFDPGDILARELLAACECVVGNIGAFAAAPRRLTVDPEAYGYPAGTKKLVPSRKTQAAHQEARRCTPYYMAAFTTGIGYANASTVESVYSFYNGHLPSVLVAVALRRIGVTSADALKYVVESCDKDQITKAASTAWWSPSEHTAGAIRFLRDFDLVPAPALVGAAEQAMIYFTTRVLELEKRAEKQSETKTVERKIEGTKTDRTSIEGVEMIGCPGQPTLIEFNSERSKDELARILKEREQFVELMGRPRILLACPLIIALRAESDTEVRRLLRWAMWQDTTIAMREAARARGFEIVVRLRALGAELPREFAPELLSLALDTSNPYNCPADGKASKRSLSYALEVARLAVAAGVPPPEFLRLAAASARPPFVELALSLGATNIGEARGAYLGGIAREKIKSVTADTFSGLERLAENMRFAGVTLDLSALHTAADPDVILRLLDRRGLELAAAPAR